MEQGATRSDESADHTESDQEDPDRVRRANKGKNGHLGIVKKRRRPQRDILLGALAASGSRRPKNDAFGADVAPAAAAGEVGLFLLVPVTEMLRLLGWIVRLSLNGVQFDPAPQAILLIIRILPSATVAQPHQSRLYSADAVIAVGN